MGSIQKTDLDNGILFTNFFCAVDKQRLWVRVSVWVGGLWPCFTLERGQPMRVSHSGVICGGDCV